jgi:hypothetical protein
MKLSVTIVGAHWRPPAKALLEVLPSDQKLVLAPEPDNPHDRHAIKVEIKTKDMPDSKEFVSAFNSAAAGYGYDWEKVQLEPIWHLGYVPAKIAATLKLPRHQFTTGRFVLDPTGTAKVEFDL